MLLKFEKINSITKYLSIYIFLSVLVYPIMSISKNNSISLIWNIGTIVLFALLCLIKVLQASWKLDIKGMIVAVILMIIQLISFFRSSIIFGENKYLSANINILISVLNTILVYSIIKKLMISVKDIKYIAKVYLVLVIIACIYNLFINSGKMINMASMTTAYTYSFHSFFGNKNLYGFVITFGIICNTFLLLINKRYKLKYTIAYIILIINLIATLSRNSLLTTIIFLILVFLLYSEDRNYKKLVYFIIIFSIGVYLLSNDNIIQFIEKYIIRKDFGLTTRDILWDMSINLLDSNDSWIWGLGLGKIGEFLENVTNVSSVHNFYLETILAGGLVKLIFYLSLIVNSFKKSIRIYKKDKICGSVFIATIICYLVYGMFESVSILGIGLMSNTCTIFMLILPNMYYNYLLFSKEVKNENKKFDY